VRQETLLKATVNESTNEGAERATKSPASNSGDREAYIAAVRNEPATEKQKAKLAWFGCTWDEGITKGQAADAIEECVRMFPEKDAEYYSRPATEEQLAKLKAFNQHPDNKPGAPYCDLTRPLTYGEAKVFIEEWARDHRQREEPQAQAHGPEPVVQAQEMKPEISLAERRRNLDEKLAELVADGEFSKEDEKALTALVLEHGFTESFTAELLRQKFTEEFLPIKRRMEQTFVMTDSDLAEIERLKKKYDIQLTLEGNAELFRTIYLVEFYGRLPEPIDPPLMLNNGETAYCAIQTRWNQVQGSTGMHKELARGVLYVSSDRLLFCGDLRNTSIVLKRIVGCGIYSDCVKITKSTGKPDYFAMQAQHARYVQALVKALK
jgi:hypothetical protein